MSSNLLAFLIFSMQTHCVFFWTESIVDNEASLYLDCKAMCCWLVYVNSGQVVDFFTTLIASECTTLYYNGLKTLLNFSITDLQF